MKELSLDVIHSQLSPKLRTVVDEGVVQEMQKLAEDPDYGDDFLDQYIDTLDVLGSNPRYTHQKYMQAVKFFSLVEMNHSLTDAYIKVFPDRFLARTKNSREKDPEKKKQIMRGEASRYNANKMLSEIRKAATIPVQLVHRHLLHEAIVTNADIMRNSTSDMVRQKAADTLIRELKPAEDQVVQIEVDDGAKSAIEELRLATEALAAKEHQSVLAGIPLREIAERNIIEVQAEEVDEEEVTHIPEDIPVEEIPEKTVEKTVTSEVPKKSNIPVPDIEDELADVEVTELGSEGKKIWKL